jgi:F-type H+-transporting ATPase subunit b
LNRYARCLLVFPFAAGWLSGPWGGVTRAASPQMSRSSLKLEWDARLASSVAPASATVWGMTLSAADGHVARAPESGGVEKQGSQKGSAKEEPDRESYFKPINFFLLVGALVYLLRKPLGSFLAQRSEAIRDALAEGRRALEHSQAQLHSIEEKLKHLQEEVAGFKAAAASEMEAERERLRQAADDEAERIMQAARAQIENSTRAAKLELKTYAAQRALEMAETMVQQRLDGATQQRLVNRFVLEVKNGSPSRS